MSRYRLALLCIVMIAGCNKPPGLQTVSIYSYTNTTPVHLSFDVYANQDDYYHSVNKLARYSLAPCATIQIPFEVSRTYWIDWYSDDYSYSNRIDSGVTGRSYSDAYPGPRITAAEENDHFDIHRSKPDS